MSAIVYCVLHLKFIAPLPVLADTPLDRFFKSRAVEYVRVLAKEIGGRQEGTSERREIAKPAIYIKTQLEMLKSELGLI